MTGLSGPAFLFAFVTPVARNAQEILATAVARAEGTGSFYPRHTGAARNAREGNSRGTARTVPGYVSEGETGRRMLLRETKIEGFT